MSKQFAMMNAIISLLYLCDWLSIREGRAIERLSPGECRPKSEWGLDKSPWMVLPIYKYPIKRPVGDRNKSRWLTNKGEV